ncbi:hypothetical protein BK704_35480 [[Bacillus thuringiensis] serovar konkukian]|nr:hypothetical protein [Bacillus thuringiensis]MED1300183.1 hypothetical protein [Bacillus pacificus]OUA91104.1 hypothetical protein BK704_35480 [[Bacillus thuringiensis] serovar konkukian]
MNLNDNNNELEIRDSGNMYAEPRHPLATPIDIEMQNMIMNTGETQGILNIQQETVSNDTLITISNIKTSNTFSYYDVLLGGRQ